MNKVEVLISNLKNWFESSSDIVVKEKSYGEFTITFMYCPHLVDINNMNQVIFPTIYDVWESNGFLTYDVISNVLDVNKPKDFNHAKQEIEEKLYSGELLIFSHDLKDLFLSLYQRFQSGVLKNQI